MKQFESDGKERITRSETIVHIVIANRINNGIRKRSIEKIVVIFMYYIIITVFAGFSIDMYTS